LSGDTGANLVEYVMLVSFIMLVALGAATYFGRNATSKFSSACDEIRTDGGTNPAATGSCG
jgi:Flp pilus assembly pilin Flp